MTNFRGDAELAQAKPRQAQALAQSQPKQAFDAQAELDGRIGEGAIATAFAAGRCIPLHVLVQPHGQRTSGVDCRVVVRPVRCLALATQAAAFTHAESLSAMTASLQQSPTR